jgi:hypothetical protein
VIHYDRPPWDLQPTHLGGVADGGMIIVPPNGFEPYKPRHRKPPGAEKHDQPRPVCPACGALTGKAYRGGEPGIWWGYFDPKANRAWSREEAAGRHVYGLTPLPLEDGTTLEQPTWQRWSSGVFGCCGAVEWSQDDAPGGARHYFRRPPPKEESHAEALPDPPRGPDAGRRPAGPEDAAGGDVGPPALSEPFELRSEAPASPCGGALFGDPPQDPPGAPQEAQLRRDHRLRLRRQLDGALALEAQLTALCRSGSPSDQANLRIVHSERERIERELEAAEAAPQRWAPSLPLFD